LEAQVAALEEKKSKLLETLAAEAGDYLQAQRLSQQLETLEATLEETLLRWMELAERA
jgi:gluconate kinase